MQRTVSSLVCLMIVWGACSESEASVVFKDSRKATGFADSAGPAPSDGPPDPFSLTFSYFSIDPVSDATVTITAFGDFDLTSEFVSVSVDGVDLGTFFDGEGEGNQYLSPISSSVTIPLALLSSLLADNELVFSFSFAATEEPVDNLFDSMQEFIQVDLMFETSTTPVIPEPSSIILLGIGAAGLAGYRWRRKRKAGRCAA